MRIYGKLLVQILANSLASMNSYRHKTALVIEVL